MRCDLAVKFRPGSLDGFEVFWNIEFVELLARTCSKGRFRFL